MNNNDPINYILVSKHENVIDQLRIALPFSNLDWGKEQALKNVSTFHKSQIIYKLVPVWEVEVITKHEFPTKEYP
jgi:hypothetical protein